MSQETLENQMKAIIDSLPTGKEFQLSDIISDPPALLGRRLFEDVQSGKIENVKCITGVDDTVQRYKKC